MLWLWSEVGPNQILKVHRPNARDFLTGPNNSHLIKNTALQLTSTAGNDEKNIDQILSHIIRSVKIKCPKVRFIPAFRRPQADQQNFDVDDLSGAGIVNRLAELQNPSDLNTYDQSSELFFSN